jgi:uncharacterized membrane protein YoaK (UPF0700 family)
MQTLRAELKGMNRMNLMSTESVTTSVGRADRQVSYVRWLLNALTVSSGAVDAISFLALGKIFTAFMTGNIAFLGMGIAGSAGAPRIVSVLASMAGFAGGIYFATRIVTPSRQPAAHEGEEPTAVVWQWRTTVALGVSLLAHLSFVLIWFATSGRPGDSVIPVLLAVWALAMGMQSAAVRKLNVGGVMTTAATATFIVLASEWANNRPLTSDEHRRLRGVLVSLIIGATAGGLVLVHAPIYAPVLPFVITVGVVATAAKAFRYPDEARDSRVKVRRPSDAPAAQQRRGSRNLPPQMNRTKETVESKDVEIRQEQGEGGR